MPIKEFLRNNLRPVIIITILLVIFSIIQITKAPSIDYMIQNNKFEKIIVAENVPTEVYNYLKEAELQGSLRHGAWFFSHSGSPDEVCYIVFCGGDKYADSYDVEIIDQKNSTYEYLGYINKVPQILVNYQFNILESNQTSVNYFEDISMPVVVFKAQKQVSLSGELASVFINQHRERLWVLNVISK